MKVRRDKLDRVFSEYIRTRDRWTCQVCFRYFPPDEKGKLQCSHFHSRRKQSVRFDESNACSKCFSCHQRLGENPLEFAAFIEARLGKRETELLNVRANQIVKRSKKDKEALYLDLKADLERLIMERS